MYNHMVGRAASIISPFYFILLSPCQSRYSNLCIIWYVLFRNNSLSNSMSDQ